MLRRLATLAVAIAGALAPAAGLPGAAAAPAPTTNSVGIRLLEAPTNRLNDPRAQTYIVDHVAPGTTITRKIEVSNGTGTVQHVTLYGGQASIGPEGWLAPGGPGGNELSGWISVAPPAVDVPAGGVADAVVSVAVPASASIGERYAVVWAQPPTATGPTGSLVNLVGIRVYLSVGPGGEPVSDFTVQSLSARRDSAGPAILAQVHNTGGRALDLSGPANLTGGPGRLSAGPFAAKGLTLGPGQSGEVIFPLDPAIPSGAWDVSVNLASGTVQHAAQARVDIPAAAQPPSAPVPASKPAGSSAGLAIGGAALLLVIAATLVLLARKRARRKAPALH